jgi:hypothetical protein
MKAMSVAEPSLLKNEADRLTMIDSP